MGKFERFFECLLVLPIFFEEGMYLCHELYSNCNAVITKRYRDKVLENALLLLCLFYVTVPCGGHRFELSVYTVLCGLLLLLCCLH